MKTIPAIKPYDPTFWSHIGRVPKFRDSERCWKFMKKHGFSRLPADVEPVFLKNLETAVKYARRIESRLPFAFEEAIRQAGPDISWKYVSEVIQAPMEEFEEVISQKPVLLVQYAKEIVEGKLPPHLEEKLVGDPYACFEYSWQILDGQLPEVLHNYMFCAVMEKEWGRRYRGGKTKLNEADEYDPLYSTPQDYFEFIKWQRKNLCRQIQHYSQIYHVDPSRSVGDLIYELEHGR